MNIAVIGQHKVYLPPERATLHLSVSAESDELAAALEAATRSANAVHDRLRGLEQEDPSPITWFAVLPVSTRSWRPWNADGLVLPPRYAATAKLWAKFRDFAALSSFAAAVGVDERVTLHDVEWSLTDATRIELEQQALTGAVADATRRATDIAVAAGATSVIASEIADPGLLTGLGGGNGQTPEPRALAMGSMHGGGAEGLDLAPEDITIEATVHARFTATGPA